MLLLKRRIGERLLLITKRDKYWLEYTGHRNGSRCLVVYRYTEHLEDGTYFRFSASEIKMQKAKILDLGNGDCMSIRVLGGFSAVKLGITDNPTVEVLREELINLK